MDAMPQKTNNPHNFKSLNYALLLGGGGGYILYLLSYGSKIFKLCSEETHFQSTSKNSPEAFLPL